MQFLHILTSLAAYIGAATSVSQAPLSGHAQSARAVSLDLFAELEELSRVVDIAYCVGSALFGINKPFDCLSRCADFPQFELITTWNTGPLLSDSCGYIAVDHGKQRILVAFRGTYSIANTVVDLSTVPQEYVPYPGSGDDIEDGEEETGVLSKDSKCTNCTVHMGFYRAWLNTRERILPDLQAQILLYPHYQLHLVGHSLGGAVAALGSLDLQARGWYPIVTTFGEPRIGNVALAKFLDNKFNLSATGGLEGDDTKQKYRRLTHINDPVPLLPLSEWSFAMHAGEIFISKESLSPDIDDLERCEGHNDQKCIAGQDSTASGLDIEIPQSANLRRSDLIATVRDEVHDLITEPWGIPSRYKLWQLFFAHRDYFWRIGLCAPGGDPMGGGQKYKNDKSESKLELR